MMKEIAIVVIVNVLAAGFLFAQESDVEHEAIRKVVKNYIVGTAYNYPDSIRMAFLPGARMFLDHKDHPLHVMKVEEYAALFEKRERGEFNGRVSRIMSIDRFEGIAFVKLEVLLTAGQRRFVDMMLLKKLEDGWKIISKTAASDAIVDGEIAPMGHYYR